MENIHKSHAILREGEDCTNPSCVIENAEKILASNIILDKKTTAITNIYNKGGKLFFDNGKELNKESQNQFEKAMLKANIPMLKDHERIGVKFEMGNK